MDALSGISNSTRLRAELLRDETFPLGSTVWCSSKADTDDSISVPHEAEADDGLEVASAGEHEYAQQITKTWVLRNTGRKPWDTANLRVISMGGGVLCEGVRGHSFTPTGQIAQNQEVRVSVVLVVVPDESELFQYGSFRLLDESRMFPGRNLQWACFGPELEVELCPRVLEVVVITGADAAAVNESTASQSQDESMSGNNESTTSFASGWVDAFKTTDTHNNNNLAPTHTHKLLVSPQQQQQQKEQTGGEEKPVEPSSQFHFIDRSQFRVGMVIGQGSFGKVMRGTLWGQDVALKQVFIKQKPKKNPSYVADEGKEDTKSQKDKYAKKLDRELDDFHAEIDMLKQLSHPNIVQFLGISQLAEQNNPRDVLLITEYLPHGSLEDVLQSNLEATPPNLLSIHKVLHYAMQMARGINWLHHHGIVHRDLKSANVLIGDNGVLKLADFGLSKYLNQGDVCTGVIGTPAYMAPEVIADKPYDAKADVFGFAIILSEMLTGEYPYDDFRASEIPDTDSGWDHAVIHKHLRPTLPERTPKALAKLIKQCWHGEPAKRPTMDQVIDELEFVNAQYQNHLGASSTQHTRVIHELELAHVGLPTLDFLREQFSVIQELQDEVKNLTHKFERKHRAYKAEKRLHKSYHDKFLEVMEKVMAQDTHIRTRPHASAAVPGVGDFSSSTSSSMVTKNITSSLSSSTGASQYGYSMIVTPNVSSAATHSAHADEKQADSGFSVEAQAQINAAAAAKKAAKREKKKKKKEKKRKKKEQEQEEEEEEVVIDDAEWAKELNKGLNRRASPVLRTTDTHQHRSLTHTHTAMPGKENDPSLGGINLLDISGISMSVSPVSKGNSGANSCTHTPHAAHSTHTLARAVLTSPALKGFALNMSSIASPNTKRIRRNAHRNPLAMLSPNQRATHLR